MPRMQLGSDLEKLGDDHALPCPKFTALPILACFGRTGGPLYPSNRESRGGGAARQLDYLQINQMGKVPALRDGDWLVTE
jgi:hypothetical protein